MQVPLTPMVILLAVPALGWHTPTTPDRSEIHGRVPMKSPAAEGPQRERPAAIRVERKSCEAPDGVSIVYSAAGAGDTALVFVHGGMADRTFFDGQIAAFADRYRVVALDLAGHGESGANRRTWSLPAFGADVAAVVDAEGLKRVVLFGNSLGGPAAVEAALLLPGRVIGVVGIDTFQDLGHPQTAENRRLAAGEARRRAEAFREDHVGAMKAMVKMLFHPDADAGLMAQTERRMLRTSPDVVYAILSGIAGYDIVPPVRRLAVPLRAINGDLFPTDVAAAKKVKADFDAIVMEHVGHYPMLEQPDEFNKHVRAVVEALTAERKPSASEALRSAGTSGSRGLG